MRSRPSIFALALAFALALPLRAQAPADPALATRVDAIAQQVLQTTGVPSASVAVVQHGRVVYTHAYGDARLDPRTPATPDMRYSIGSISKQFTAAAVLLLQEQGKLSLDDPVAKYVPGLARGNEVTIRQLLSHTSGYQDFWPQDYVMPMMLKPTTPQAILDRWAGQALDFEPGTRWQYSNTNYAIAGLIVQKVSGTPFFEFLRQRILAPLGLQSALRLSQDAEPRIADLWRQLDAALEPGPYLLGERFTACDVYMYMLSTWHRERIVPLSRFARLHRNLELVSAKRGVQKMMLRNAGH